MKARGLRELDELDSAFGALAHETRRHVLLVLRYRGGTMTAGEIAGRFDCTWPTVSRHLKVLVDAGLVSAARRGRERVYTLTPEPLDTVVEPWLAHFR